MPGTPVRLAGPTALANAAATLYTVGAGKSALVRHIHFSNPTGSTATVFTISIGADAAGTRVFDVFPLAAGAVYDYYPYTKLAAAEIIQGFSDVAAKIVVEIEGDEWVAG